MEDNFADRFRIKSGRLKNWDYSNSGIYFVTICTLNHNKFFGKIENGKMIYKQSGEIVKDELLKTFEIRKYLKLINWVIMPNHLHLLFCVREFPVQTLRKNVETCRRRVSTYNKSVSENNIHKPEIAIKKWKANSVGSTINQIKSISTKRIRNKNLFFAWQSRYYDEIIFDQKRLIQVVNYIKNNPKNWEKDKLFLK